MDIVRKTYRTWAFVGFLIIPFVMILLTYQLLQVSQYRYVVDSFTPVDSDDTTPLGFSHFPTEDYGSSTPEYIGSLYLGDYDARSGDYAFIPSFRGRLVITSGDRILFDSVENNKNLSPNIAKTAFFEFTVSDGQLVQFQLFRDEAIFVGMSDVFIGNQDVLLPSVNNLKFYSYFMRTAYWGAEVLIVVSMLILMFFGLIGDRLRSLIFICLFLVCLQAPAVLSEYVDIFYILPYLYSFVFILVYFYIHFLESIENVCAKNKIHNHYKVYLLLSGISFITCVLSPQVGYLISVFISFPMLILVLLYGAARSFRSFVNYGAIEAVVFGSGSLTVGIATLHDFAVRIGVVDSYIFASGTAAFCFFIAGIFLIASAANDVKVDLQLQYAKIESELSQKKSQLAAAFNAREKLKEREAAAVEKQRITQDLHDGVLTYLSMIKSLTEGRSGPDSAHAYSLATNAMQEIRVILETDILEESSTFIALSVFRNQISGPLLCAGVELNWDLLEIRETTCISSEHALNLVRIFQEAVHNAVERASCTKLSVSAYRNREKERLILSIINSGGQSFSHSHRQGQGIKNMKRRANKIGADFSIEPTSSGAKVLLSFPFDNYE